MKGDPNGIDMRLWQADVLKALGKPEEAEAALRAATRLKPGDQSAWLSLLMLQLSRRETTAAAATIEQIRDKVQADNKDLLLAQCYRALGNFAKAEVSFREAVRKAPNDPGVQTAAITFFEQTGRYDEAVRLLRDLHRRQPTNTWATRKLALRCAARRRNREAWDEAIALVKADPQPNDLPDDLVTLRGRLGTRTGTRAQGKGRRHLGETADGSARSAAHPRTTRPAAIRRRRPRRAEARRPRRRG